MEGWIKLHRKFITWEWFDDPNMIKLFIYLLLSANHKQGNWRGINVERGQLITGLNSLSEKTKLSIQTLRTCLSRLERSGEIKSESTNKYRLITVCEYDSYQTEQQTTNKLANNQSTGNQQSTNNQSTTNKNVKKEDNNKNDKKRFTPPTLEQVISYCKERENKVDPQRFIDHYQSKGWRIGKTPMKDWKAAVRTWEKGDDKPSDQTPTSKHYQQNTSKWP